MELRSEHACFGGRVQFWTHASQATRTDMEFSVFVPPQTAHGPVPVLYWLSGLTCTAENFTVKAGAQRFAAQHGLLLVAPDTSPRGAGIEGEDDRYDLGTGAGFYVDATTPGWATHYRMYSYVTHELPGLVAEWFPARADRASIFGHSMGGHGALVCALRNPGRYRSVSAFAPICAPSRCPWGQLAFSTYLGDDRETWLAYDATALIASAPERLPILIDQGAADTFLDAQLQPAALEAACKEHGHPLELRMQPGYDHSYYTIATFVGEHMEHHARALLRD